MIIRYREMSGTLCYGWDIVLWVGHCGLGGILINDFMY
jgi:hypothetical protein